jgi:outer membrane protein TolC
MRIARNSFSASTTNLESARQSLFPTARAIVSTKASQQFSSSENSYSANASVGADFEVSPSRYLQFKSEKKRYNASGRHLEQQNNDVVAGIMTLYVQTVGADRMIEVAREDSVFQQSKLLEIEAFFQQGIKAHADVLQQRAMVAEAQASLLKAIKVYRLMEASLLDAIGVPIVNHYRLDTAEVMVLVARCFSGDTLMRPDTVVPESEEIAAQRLRLEAATAALKGARLSYVPAVSLNAGWGGQKQVYSGRAVTSNGLDAGASVSVPLLDQGQRSQMVSNARIAQESARLELERLERSAEKSLHEAVLADTLGMEIVAAAAARYDASNEALSAMEGRYAAGTATLTDLISVRKNFTEARSALVQARFECLVNRINLFGAAGRIDRIAAIVRDQPHHPE